MSGCKCVFYLRAPMPLATNRRNSATCLVCSLLPPVASYDSAANVPFSRPILSIFSSCSHLKMADQNILKVNVTKQNSLVHFNRHGSADIATGYGLKDRGFGV